MTPEHPNPDRRRRIVRAIVAVAVLAALVAGLIGALKKGTSELPVYTTGAERMVEGVEVFRPEDEKVFTYPPFFAVPFVPFTWLPQAAHRPIWYFVNVGVLAWIIVLLRRIALAARPDGAREIWLWVIVAALAARHVAAVFQNQSHDLLILLSVALAARAMQLGRDGRAGAMCGIGAACKATPLLFLPMFVGQLRVRAALGFLVALALATLLPDLLLPRQDGALWIQAWFGTFFSSVTVGDPAHGSGAWSAKAFLNQNLAGTIYRLSVPAAPEEVSDFVRDVAVWAPSEQVRKAVTLAAQLIVVALIAWAAWPTRARGLADAAIRWRRVGEAGLIVCGMLLLSPMSSKSHFCALLLPAVFCTAEILWCRFRRSTAILLGVSFMLGSVTTKGLLGRELGNDVLAMGSVTWCAFAMLLASASVLVTRRATRAC